MLSEILEKLEKRRLTAVNVSEEEKNAVDGYRSQYEAYIEGWNSAFMWAVDIVTDALTKNEKDGN